MIPGLKAAIYYVDDINKAKAWYNQVLRTKPYYEKPFYVGYDIGGFELGLEPGKAIRGNSPIVYWGVQNVAQELTRLISLGAAENGAVKVVNGDVKVASIIDPFGNIFGMIENHHVPSTVRECKALRP